MKRMILTASLTVLTFFTVMSLSFLRSGAEDYFRIVEEMGYTDVVKTPYEVVELTLPEEFNDVYERYNALQKEGGYDLTLYKGEKCRRYTYIIPSQNARANIIVCRGKIIGGDISGITLDGIMKPLLRRESCETG